MKNWSRLLCLVVGGLSLMNLTQAKVVTTPVIYEHAGVKLEGYLAYDDEKVKAGKRPGVLVVPEWWGLNDYAKSRARQLAELGYVAFAADMYGQGVVTTDAKKASELSAPFYGKPLMAERAQAGYDQLLKADPVDTSNIAAIGFCFGGTTVQTLAYSGTPLKGIVSFHGGLLPAPTTVIGKVSTKFLMLNGAIDPLVKEEDKVAFKKSLEEARVDYQFIDYSGALHSFSNPAAHMPPAAGYNEPAARRSWLQMQSFFSEIFPAK